MADSPALSYSADPTLYLYTSLTAGSSHIITATSRLETILKANKIPFRAIDVATDEKARMLWGRRSRGKKLPGLVRYGLIVGDLEQIEEWNEYGELKDQIGSTDPELGGNQAASPPAPPPVVPPAPLARTPSTAPHIQITDTPSRTSSAAGGKDENKFSLALRQAGEEAAAKAKENARAKLGVQQPSALKQEAVVNKEEKMKEPKLEKKDEKKQEEPEEEEVEEEEEEEKKRKKKAKRRVTKKRNRMKTRLRH